MTFIYLVIQEVILNFSMTDLKIELCETLITLKEKCLKSYPLSRDVSLRRQRTNYKSFDFDGRGYLRL